HEAVKTGGDDFKDLFSGGHGRSFMALKEGQADVACTSPIFTDMAGEGSPLFPFEEGEFRSIGESMAMPISTSTLASPNMSETKREALLEALPKLYSEENRDVLGIYMDSVPENAEPIMEPSKDMYQPFVDIAAVADVDIADLD